MGYDGGWNRGQFNDEGVYVNHKTGEKYTGNWHNDLRHG